MDEVDLLSKPPTANVAGTLDRLRQDPRQATTQAGHVQGRRSATHTVTLPAFGVTILSDLFAVTGPVGSVVTNREGDYGARPWLRRCVEHRQFAACGLRAARAPTVGDTALKFRWSVATVGRDRTGVEVDQQWHSHAQMATTEGHYLQGTTAGPDTRAVLDKWARNEGRISNLRGKCGLQTSGVAS